MTVRRYLFYISELYGFAISRPLQSAIVARGDEVAWFLEDKDRLCRHMRSHELLLEDVESVRRYNPCAVFVPGNMVPDFFPGIKVELFHGFHARKRSERRGHFRIRGFFDLYCTQGPDTTIPFKQLERQYGFFEVVETGWPKMDPLFWDTETFVTVKDRPVVLLTSTFTPKLSCARALFPTVRMLAAKGRWKWLVNFHPKMDPAVVDMYKSLQGSNLTYVDTDEIIPLLKSADVMVSDTSSIISEFLLRYRPVVTFRNRDPGPHIVNIVDPSRLESAIEYALTMPDDLLARIRDYADFIHPYRDGKSSFRVLEATDRLVQKGLGHLKKKPLNLIRRIKMRKRLGYYHIK